MRAVGASALRAGALAAALWGLAPGTPPLGAALAADPVVAFEREADRERYERLLHDYRCLKCQNQSIADSAASLAGDLREQIRTRVVAGDDDAEIDEYLVSRYGDFVRYRPRFGGTTALLWLGPFALLAAGLGAGVLMARRGAGAGTATGPGADRGGRLDEARRLLDDDADASR